MSHARPFGKWRLAGDRIPTLACPSGETELTACGREASLEPPLPHWKGGPRPHPQISVLSPLPVSAFPDADLVPHWRPVLPEMCVGGCLPRLETRRMQGWLVSGSCWGGFSASYWLWQGHVLLPEPITVTREMVRSDWLGRRRGPHLGSLRVPRRPDSARGRRTSGQR